MAAAVVTWALIEKVAGVDLRAPSFDGSAEGFDIGLGPVVLTSGLASLGGWGLLAVLERLTTRARGLWTAAAVPALVASLGGPMSGTGISGANRASLALLHVVVGAVLIPLLHRTTSAPSGAPAPGGGSTSYGEAA